MTQWDSDQDSNSEDTNETPPVEATVRYLIAFTWFYRRYWIGSLLLIGVGVWIFVSTFSDTQTHSNDSARIPQSELPQAKIELAQISEQVNEINWDSENGLADQDKKELLDAVLHSRQTSITRSDGVSVQVLVDRLTALRQLMNHELTKTEKVFTLTSYIETLVMLDWSNVVRELGLEHTREAVEELDRLYADHADPAIAGRANLAHVMIPGYLYLASKSDQELLEFRSRLDQRLPKILNDLKSTKQLTEFVGLMIRGNEHAETIDQLTRMLIDQAGKIDGPKYRQVQTQLEAKLLFGRIEVDSLVHRIEIGDQSSEADIRALMQGLSNADKFHESAYQVAFTCVGSLFRIGKTEKALHLNQQVQAIVLDKPGINDEKRELILNIVKRADQQISQARSDSTKTR